MTNLHSKRSKRALSEDDSESDTPPFITTKSQNFAKFIVIQAMNKDKPITSLSPFVIEKQISAILGTPKSIKNLRNGTLLVECHSKQQADNLLKTSLFFNHEVNVFAHPTLNSSRGVVRCKEISDTPLDEVKEKMLKEGVTDVKRITVKRNGKDFITNTYIFTFNSPVVPKKVKIAYHIKDVEVYIPNPLRCFRCQKFGHHEDGCRAQMAVCGRCAETGHTFKECKADEPRCANCQQNHQSHSRSCTFWKKEKEILRIKHSDNVSFTEARSIFTQRNKILEQNNSDLSYANVTKPKPAECETCKVLVDKMCLLFPEKALEIRQLVQSSKESLKDKPVSTSIPATPSTLEVDQTHKQKQTSDQTQKSKEKSSNSRQVKQKSPKPVKVNQAPKQKISLPGNCITKNASADTAKSKEKKQKISRIVLTENNEVAFNPIPTSPNRFGTLEDMEDMDVPLERQQSSWKNPPDSWDEQSESDTE